MTRNREYELHTEFDVIGMKEAARINRLWASEKSEAERQYLEAMESPEQVELRAWDKEYNREPSQSFCDEL